MYLAQHELESVNSIITIIHDHQQMPRGAWWCATVLCYEGTLIKASLAAGAADEEESG